MKARYIFAFALLMLQVTHANFPLGIGTNATLIDPTVAITFDDSHANTESEFTKIIASSNFSEDGHVSISTGGASSLKLLFLEAPFEASQNVSFIQRVRENSGQTLWMPNVGASKSSSSSNLSATRLGASILSANATNTQNDEMEFQANSSNANIERGAGLYQVIQGQYQLAGISRSNSKGAGSAINIAEPKIATWIDKAILKHALSAPMKQQEKLVVKESIDLEYSKPNGYALRYDYFKPSDNKKRPLIILIHGGAWKAGSKSNWTEEGQWWANQGFAAASINYRLAPQFHFPAPVADAQRFVQYARANADRLGIDPNKIVAMGHSAGGHISAMLGAVDRYLGADAIPELDKISPKVNAVIDTSGPTDFLDTKMLQNIPGHENVIPLLMELLASGPDNLAARFRQKLVDINYPLRDIVGPVIDAMMPGVLMVYTLMQNADIEKWKAASPAFQVNEQTVPHFIVQADNDNLVPTSQAETLRDKLNQLGIKNEYRLLPGQDHTSYINNPKTWQPLQFEFLRFIKTVFRM